MFDSPPLSPSPSMPSSCLSKHQTMCRQRASVRFSLTCLVGILAVLYRDPRLNPLPALFRSAGALSSLVVVLVLAARFAVLLFASALTAPSCCRVWSYYPHWRVRPGPRCRAGRLPSRFAGSSWAAGPLWVAALGHCRFARGQILSRHHRPRSCDHVSSAERVLRGRGQVQHRGLAPRGSTRRVSTWTRPAACRVSASDQILSGAILLDGGIFELIVHGLTIMQLQ